MAGFYQGVVLQHKDMDRAIQHILIEFLYTSRDDNSICAAGDRLAARDSPGVTWTWLGFIKQQSAAQIYTKAHSAHLVGDTTHSLNPEDILCCLQEAGLLPDNIMWPGAVREPYGRVADTAQADYNSASAKVKTGYQMGKTTMKDRSPEF